jgi:hypothetical protein
MVGYLILIVNILRYPLLILVLKGDAPMFVCPLDTPCLRIAEFVIETVAVVVEFTFLLVVLLTS